jgi:putative MATE family efflux protein
LELGTVIALVMTALCLILLRPVLVLMHTPRDILEDTVRYLRIMFAGILFTFTGQVLSSAFHALGDSKTPLYTFIASAVLNILLDIALIRWTGMGAAAAALATVIAQGLSALFCLWRLFQRRDVRLCRGDFAPDRKVIRELLRLGAPMGARDWVAALGGTVIQYAINPYGMTAIAGIGAAKKLYSLLFIIGGGLEGAAAVFVAQNYGARRFDRIASGMAAARRVMLAGLLLIIPLMFFAGRRVLGLFISGGPEETRAVLDVAVNQTRVCLALLPALYMLFLYRSGLQGMGNSFMPMASGFLEAGLRAAAALVLPGFFGLRGLYMAEPIGWPLMALQLFAAFRADFRKKRGMFGARR